MKPCYKCGKEYDPTGGNPSYCKPCKKEHDREYYANNKKRRDSIRESNRERRKKIRVEVQEYKRNKGCKYCDEREPVCLDFHHPDDNKEFDVATRIDYSRERLWDEIAKCEVVCKNHHAKIHAGILDE